MAKASDALSQRTNQLPVGLYGGRGPKDLNNKDSNIRPKPIDDDRDGKPDYGVARELSEDVNASTLKGK